MLLSLLTIVAAAVGQGSARAFVNTVDPTCAKDQCLKTVIANSKQGGQVGCTAFFRYTVVPPTSTSTSTVSLPKTVTRTITSTDSVSTTDYASTTTTASTDEQSASTTTTKTTTVTVTSTIIVPYQPGSGPNTVKVRGIQAKTSTISATTVPTYASAVCADVSQYSSACSCISVKHDTTTASTPVTTKTVTRHPKTITRTTSLTTTTTVIQDPGTLIVTTTTTVTSTQTESRTESESVTTTTFTPEASPTCGNAGLAWAYYTYQGTSINPPYSDYDPTVYKSMTPVAQGSVNGIGGFNSFNGQVYGDTSKTLPTTRFVLNHRGWFYAATTGTYTISISKVDDDVLVWSGSTAYSGWTRNNALLEVKFAGQSGGSGTFPISVGQGYNPIRIMFLQANGGASFAVSITDQNNNVVASTSAGSSPNIIQFGCFDEDNAPQFPPFGDET